MLLRVLGGAEQAIEESLVYILELGERRLARRLNEVQAHDLVREVHDGEPAGRSLVEVEVDERQAAVFRDEAVARRELPARARHDPLELRVLPRPLVGHRAAARAQSLPE